MTVGFVLAIGAAADIGADTGVGGDTGAGVGVVGVLILEILLDMFPVFGVRRDDMVVVTVVVGLVMIVLWRCVMGVVVPGI